MATSFNIQAIAKLLKLSERRIQQLAKDNIIPKAERGKYDLVSSVHGYIDFLKAKAGGDFTAEEVLKNKNLKDCLLKIDVEGYELNVLNGSINTIKNQVKFILIEKQFFNQYQGVSHKKVEMLLKKHNFKLIKKFTYPLFHFQDNLYKKV